MRERRMADGLVQVAVWVPAARVPELQEVAKALCADRTLEVGPMRSMVTGKLLKRSASA
jgi:hypothetical protein